ncbi:MAG: type II toxin-antitoxin system RelE/ParE family toxin [Spirochaetales bacterium]|nr:type II toxin-antitoxin system RelE/ParE family toxin [Spirochaetales bacterium]
MQKELIWSQDASNDLYNIVAYVKEKSGKSIAFDIYNRIIEKVEILLNYPETGRTVPELINIGILDFRELIEAPWRIFYKISDTHIYIVSIIDGRRNVEEILYGKVIYNKGK